ncbi:phosphonate-transporting ATPase [Sporocytophaga myxococcoides]|uniref:Phosphonate-transporting ATPase n=1 Tax=Sporocytophaga myxococcoides TaxID=153721 RepID=A0A098LFE7_9BACT|nr:ATP-binding cassette domain-containing protein [Sporocytophaga myxococcoides]GAL85189.1 phosphonate-transporting ATPase [Sporocytophaga myxococcoides]
MKEDVIVVKDLFKSFNGKKVLEGININLKKEENLCIIGKSGSGKSVLLRSIIGLIEPDSGSISVFGKNLDDLNEDEIISLRKKVGYLFQEGALYDSMNVEENLAFPLKRQPHPKSHKEIKATVQLALKRVGLLSSINKMPQELSGGMKKRIALARTLILEPEVILYDEPTTGLDPVTSKEIIELILEMRATYGISAIIVTHDMYCARLTADRILLLNNGKMDIEGSFDELKRSDKGWVRAFFE